MCDMERITVKYNIDNGVKVCEVQLYMGCYEYFKNGVNTTNSFMVPGCMVLVLSC